MTMGAVKSLVVLLLQFSAYTVSAASTYSLSESVTHESTAHSGRKQWHGAARVHSAEIVPLRIGLTQQNLDKAYEKLLEISHPDSASYGKTFSREEVHELFQPSKTTNHVVIEWLVASGIPDDEIVRYENGGWLQVHLPASKVEALFETELFEYTHHRSGDVMLGSALAPRKADAQPERRSLDFSEVSARVIQHIDPRLVQGQDPFAGLVSPHPPYDKHLELPPELRGCGLNLSVPCLRAMYGLPAVTTNDSINSPAIFETYYTFAQSEMDQFFGNYTPWSPAGTAPRMISINGGRGPLPANDTRTIFEPNINLQLLLPLVYPQQVTVYQVDDPPQAKKWANDRLTGFLNTFFDALDGSYCHYCYEGLCGDSPGIDASYPDSVKHGYNGTRMCGAFNHTRVISISYGTLEISLPRKYQQRQCNEILKLGLQGVTVITASGDYGVAEFSGDGSSGCLSGCGLDESETHARDVCPYKQNGTIYNPDALSSCPYILSVGGTQLGTFVGEDVMEANLSPFDNETTMQIPMDNSPYYASAGGFSNFFPRPEYQNDAVQHYFASNRSIHHPYYMANDNVSNIGANGGIFNRAGRGYPDVSAAGANYPGVYSDADQPDHWRWSGTSMAAPIWAAVITLINIERTKAGKGPVGFVQPVLYAHPEVLNDITNGSNPNCGTEGFQAVGGWDPVTGLGTPNFPQMKELFLSLP